VGARLAAGVAPFAPGKGAAWLLTNENGRNCRTIKPEAKMMPAAVSNLKVFLETRLNVRMVRFSVGAASKSKVVGL